MDIKRFITLDPGAKVTQLFLLCDANKLECLSSEEFSDLFQVLNQVGMAM